MCGKRHVVYNKILPTDKTTKKEEPSADIQLHPEPDTTIYVKNLNFSTTEEVLKQVQFVKVIV